MVGGLRGACCTPRDRLGRVPRDWGAQRSPWEEEAAARMQWDAHASKDSLALALLLSALRQFQLQDTKGFKCHVCLLLLGLRSRERVCEASSTPGGGQGHMGPRDVGICATPWGLSCPVAWVGGPEREAGIPRIATTRHRIAATRHRRKRAGQLEHGVPAAAVRDASPAHPSALSPRVPASTGGPRTQPGCAPHSGQGLCASS